MLVFKIDEVAKVVQWEFLGLRSVKSSCVYLLSYVAVKMLLYFVDRPLITVAVIPNRGTLIATYIDGSVA